MEGNERKRRLEDDSNKASYSKVLMAFVIDIKLVKSFDWNEKNHYISFLASCTKTQVRFI